MSLFIVSLILYCQISKVEGSLTVTANGRGIGMLQVGVTYYVDKAPDKSSFNFIIEVRADDDDEAEVVMVVMK